eukprot:snap_masked-scaffold_10-processed-gene-7.22-mRNA-1 protein AED:1.00 eAED:1.00 QI:0/0/0/0/1/1/2/0/232
MNGSIETYEIGKNENGMNVLQFLIQKDAASVWSGVKDFDKLVALLCSDKGAKTRIMGNNGQTGSVYTCHYVIQHRGDHRDESRTLKYQINGLDELNRKLTLTVSETSNGQQISRSNISISIEKYSLNNNYCTYKMESIETYSRGSSAKYCGIVIFLPFLIGMIVTASTVGFLFALPIGELKNAHFQLGELVDLLRTYFLNPQQEVQGLNSATPIAESVWGDDGEQGKFAQVV